MLTRAVGHTLLQARQFKKGRWRGFGDMVAQECVIGVAWRDATMGTAGETTLRAWPHDLEDLAGGHILLEKTDPGMAKRAIVARKEEYLFSVTLESAPTPDRATTLRHVAPEVLLNAMRDFIAAPGHRDATGCLHRAGVLDPQNGTLLAQAEDIGRHNCLDRLAGWSNASGTSLADTVLLVSARLTGSLCAKALRAGFRVLVSRSAVTTDAVAQARESGAALLGFARPEEERITVFVDALGRVDARRGE